MRGQYASSIPVLPSVNQTFERRSWAVPKACLSAGSQVSAAAAAVVSCEQGGQQHRQGQGHAQHLDAQPSRSAAFSIRRCILDRCPRA